MIGAVEIDVSHNEPDGVQFEITGEIAAGSIMLTLRTGTPMGVQGSLAFLTEDGPMVIPFHQTMDGFMVHQPEGV